MTFPYLHEQDATGAEAYTSARWLGWDLEFWLGTECFSSHLGQIWHGAGVFDEFLQGGHDGRASEELTKQVDLAAKLIVRNGLDEFFGGGTRSRVKFRDLCSGRARCPQHFTLCRELRDQSRYLGASSVDTSTRQKQIARKGVARVTLETRNPAKARDQSQAQLGKGKTRHLVGNDDIAG